MSRASRSSAAPPQNMPQVQEIVMGPPPLPLQVVQPPPPKPKDPQEVQDKYRRLKRKYFELEEKHKETIIQLKTSGERNVKWRSERALLLDRISELEGNPQVNPGAPIPAPPFSAFPRSLLSVHNQKLFVNNLRQAIDEVEREDPDIDPFVLSRHIGPEARKRQEAEFKEKQEEEAREARRAARNKLKGAQKGKDIGTPLTFAPQQPNASVLVSSSGTRLRLKPPAPPSGEAGPASASSSSTHHQSGLPPQSSSHGTVSGVHHSRQRSESPVSPIEPSPDDFPLRQYQQPPPPPPPPQSEMQLTLRASPAGLRPSDIQRHTKPKRLKAHTVQSKSYNIPMVPRDKHGKPLLPLNVGIMTVINLGDICMREHFHTERYIFPIGYEVTRRYLSMIDPNAEVVYHCTILDGGDGPKFKIVAGDVPEKPMIAGTATGAWSAIVRQANHIRHRQHSNSVSGPDFFGLGQNTIKHLIQELPNAHQLKDYVWQHFVEGGPLGGRHAAVIPALPEEHDGQMIPSGIYMDMDQDRARELQIVQVDHEGPVRGQAYLPPPPNMAPISFQQEYQEYVRPPEREQQRGRRSSRSSSHAYEEYGPGSSATPVQAMSPPNHRMSHSPVLHRDRDRERASEHDHYSPQQGLPTRSHSHSSVVSSPHAHMQSPYAQPHNGEGARTPRHYVPAQSPPPVPATLASIMHAYPAPPIAPAGSGGSGAEPAEYVYANGNGSGGRRNGHGGMQTFPPS